MKTKKKTNELWIKKQIEKGLCTKCKEKAVVKLLCEKHRNDLNRRRRVEYLEERFKKKYGVKV